MPQTSMISISGEHIDHIMPRTSMTSIQEGEHKTKDVVANKGDDAWEQRVIAALVGETLFTDSRCPSRAMQKPVFAQLNLFIS